MKDDLNSGQKRPDEVDPLSATAMFLRAIEKPSDARRPEPSPPASEPAVPGRATDRLDGSSFEPSLTSSKGEFTSLFGDIATPPSTSEGATPIGSISDQRSSEQVRLEAVPESPQPSGEFTQIFVKNPQSAKQSAPTFEEPQGNLPAPQVRPKGFSSPGVSDAASSETSFSQIFKPGAKVGGGSPEAHPTTISGLRPEGGTASPAADSPRREMQFNRRNDAPNAVKPDPSITGLIKSLSSSSPAESGPAVSQPAPYRPDPVSSYQPVAKPAAASNFDTGGVTQFIQRLSNLPAMQPASPPPPPDPGPSPEPGPGEFTRIISSPIKAAATGAPSPAPAPPPALKAEAAFAGPPAPALPQSPMKVPMPPASAPAIRPMAPLPVLPPPPAPALPSMAAPKGKLEALVPMLLVVNTFLLVIILVVMIFLIKTR